MKTFKSKQEIKQFDKHRGGYFYLEVPADVVNKFPNKRSTRFICTINQELIFQCGLNHLGDGNYFIILSKKNCKILKKDQGDLVTFELKEDPDPLGLKMPQVLEALLEQDRALKSAFDKLSVGKKRTIMHAVLRVKDVDKQVKYAIKYINDPIITRRKSEK